VSRRTRPGRLPLAATALLGLGGCELRFGEPGALWLLWLAPAMGAFLAWSISRRQALAGKLVAPGLLARLAPAASPGRLALKAALVLTALVALVLALAQPRYGFAWEETRRRGVDLIVAIDVSGSMLAADEGAEVTRLDRARRKLTDLVGMLEGDRVGLVAFAGAAFLECPLTLDYGAFTAFLDELGPDLISARGTNLEDAVRVALKGFEGGAAESRAILLVTDGEETVGDVTAAAADAQKAGVRIYTIGIGRSEGAPIPGPDGGFRRDSRGELVLSKLDEPTLRDVALTSGGAYVRSVTGDVDLETLYRGNIKAALSARELGSRRQQRWNERYQWLVGLALAALTLELLLPERVRRRNAR
jgi:Ca-activated chloride channel family protein